MAQMTEEQLQEYIVGRVSLHETYEDLLAFPKYFEMETVNACNARCVMCPLPQSRRKPMSDELFKKISDEIISHAGHVKRVALYRDGEPLLDPKLPERIAVFKQKGIKRVGISTNVSLLTKERAKAVLNAGLDEIILSIDSLKKEVFENIRQGLTFETVMENALMYIKLRNKLRPASQIWVRMVRQETNAGEWEAYEAFWKEKLNESDRVNFHEIHNWGGQLDGSNTDKKNTEKEMPCIALWSLMPIFSDGTVPLCNVDFQAKHVLGDLNCESIEEIWKSDRMARIRQEHLAGQKGKTARICRDCNAWTLPSDYKVK